MEPMNIDRVLAENIRRFRKAKGWSQEFLAGEAGVHRTYVSQVERCSRNPTIQTVAVLASALGVAAYRLLKEGGTE